MFKEIRGNAQERSRIVTVRAEELPAYGLTAKGIRTRRGRPAFRTDAPPEPGAAARMKPEALAALEGVVGGIFEARMEKFVKDSFPELLRAATGPQALLSAAAGDAEGMRAALEAAGWGVHERSISPGFLAGAYREQIAFGSIDNAFGSHVRSRCMGIQYSDEDGRKRTTFIHNPEVVNDCHAWMRAVILKRDSMGVDPVTRDNAMTIRDRLEKWVRAPGSGEVHTGADGSSGSMGATVPTIIAAEVWQLIAESYPLPGLVQKYVSAAPLRIPREKDDVTVYTGGNLTDLTGTKATVDYVQLSPNRVGAITFVDPQLALASAIGIVRYVINRLARAYARFLQDSIISGNGTGKPKGWLAQETANVDERLNIKVQPYDDTDQTSKRGSVRRGLYQVPQYHRGENPATSTFRWVGNGECAVELESHNDTDKEPWSDELQTYLRRKYVETTQIATEDSATTLLGADFNAYAMQESPSGMEIEQTREGAGAFEAHAIAVKIVTHIDGDVILPNAGVLVTGVNAV